MWFCVTCLFLYIDDYRGYLFLICDSKAHVQCSTLNRDVNGDGDPCLIEMSCLQDLEDTVAKALDVSKVRSKTDIGKVQDIQDLWSIFTARLEYRLTLGKMYFDFHRHRQLVSISRERLSSAIKWEPRSGNHCMR